MGKRWGLMNSVTLNSKRFMAPIAVNATSKRLKTNRHFHAESAIQEYNRVQRLLWLAANVTMMATRQI
jgi:hypothetical protein